MRVNATREKLLRGEAAFGFGLGLGSPIAAEVLSHSGIDFILVDGQHGSFGGDGIIATLTAISTGPATPIVRVARNDYTQIGRLLDDGALGIVIPMVDTAEDAKAAADACRFPPVGTRSYGWGRASHFGADYPEAVNDQVLVMVQIESATAVKNAEAILATPGVDGCWVGPGDLSLSMGFQPSEAMTNDAIVEAIDSVVTACRNTGTIPGYAGAGADQARILYDRGFRFITCGSDVGFLLSGAAGTLAGLPKGDN